MIFSSQLFLFLFLPLCLLLYYTFPKSLRNAILLVFSIIFYAWGETQYLWLILFSILFNYGLGFLVKKKTGKKFFLTFGIVINLGFLVYYKYLGFFAGLAHVELNDSIKSTVLPLGISFYTFHAISYLIDIYREKSVPQKNIFRMGLYIVNFPQLIAGPIIRYHDVDTQLSARRHTLNRFANGLFIFITGLAKKVIIANTLGEMTDALFKTNMQYVNGYLAWMGMIAYTLQLYFDFSGYSDMAIGLGRMFGFEFMKNFNYPYISKSIKEFWRRWHISLSNWFRDYLYIPLGGNAGSNTRTAFNLFTIFILCGLWHGASLNFLVWGLFHGFFLSLERGAWGRLLRKTPSFIRNIYVWLVVLTGWVFFRSDDLTTATTLLKKMLFLDQVQLASVDLASFINPYFLAVLTTAILFALKLPYRTYMYLTKKQVLQPVLIRSVGFVLLLLLLLVCMSEIVSGNYNPFIYYRF